MIKGCAFSHSLSFLKEKFNKTTAKFYGSGFNFFLRLDIFDICFLVFLATSSIIGISVIKTSHLFF